MCYTSCLNDQRYRRNVGSVFSLKYHLVWYPKYRRPILLGDGAKDLQDLLYQTAKELEAEIEALETQSDHVHRFVSSDPPAAPQRLANQFKGFTSQILRQK